ncbi:uncharacterized protein E0L32_008535 [Thyridium curvatum]|uniref:Peroxin-7 n=1 Tax=Thyridium curvatum TaxID=1093900 RepID=A0A507AJI7_9PEZI|nr:uncharacterized protein E0L32_008535 [Thyridium curvatum]TPX10485.1 hypothetical protein E0L32_008535 [Thyridium curvatum]
MAGMLEFRTPGFNPYAVKYSPYYDNRVAVATSANYGIVGNGKVFSLRLTAQGPQVETTSALTEYMNKRFDTNDAQYDLAWSELNENQLLVACGDGSIKLFDMTVKDFPVMNFHEHKRETFSVSWSPVTKDTFISSSWDGTVKQVTYCPSNPAIISAASSDSHIRIFDLRTPPSAKYHLTATIPVHMPGQQGAPRPGAPLPVAAAPSEQLTHDWNKYRDTVIATGGVDRVLRTFDIRNPAGGPLSVMQGHQYAVRRLAWSPHAADILISASYDMTVRVWTDGSTMPAAAAAPDQAQPVRMGMELGLMNHHTEFVTGVDWCLFGTGGWVASVGWDERVLMWDANSLLRR